MQLEPHGVGAEGVAGQPGPTDRVFTFLDPLLCGAAPVVELQNFTTRAGGRLRWVTMKPMPG